MTTVRNAILDLLRSHHLTTWFGNPGSSELALLHDFPDDFRYLLGLQEMVPVGMADAYAQITGRPALVNLHTAPGMGNAQGQSRDIFHRLSQHLWEHGDIVEGRRPWDPSNGQDPSSCWCSER